MACSKLCTKTLALHVGHFDFSHSDGIYTLRKKLTGVVDSVTTSQQKTFFCVSSWDSSLLDASVAEEGGEDDATVLLLGAAPRMGRQMPFSHRPVNLSETQGVPSGNLV